MSNINIKRIEKTKIKQTLFKHIYVGTIFEDSDEECLYIKISENQALQVGDYCLTCFGNDVIVNEVEVEINYKRKYDSE